LLNQKKEFNYLAIANEAQPQTDEVYSKVPEDHAYCERWLRSTVGNCKQFSPMI